MRRFSKIMKRKIYILFIAILAVCLTGCSKAKEISVTSCELVSLSPSGLKSIDGTVAVGIHNPMFEFRVTNTSGVVYYKGAELVYFTVDDFAVEPHCDEKYNLTGRASLAPGISLFTVLGLARNIKAEQYTIDVSTTMKAKGLHKTITRKGIPLEELMNAAK